MRITPLIRREFALLAHAKWLWIITVPILWVGNNFLTITVAQEPWLAIAASSTAVVTTQFAAIIVCFRAIIGERESGSIRVTAGTPLSRTEILVGTALGRGLALALPVGFGVLGITLLGWSRYGALPLGSFAGFLLVALLLVILYSNLITALSATTSTTIRAAALSLITVWLLGDGSSLFTSLYEVIVGHPVNLQHPPSDPIFFLIHRLFPLNAYRVVVNSLLGLPNTHEYFVNALQAANSGQQTGFAVTEVFGSTPPFYLTPWFAVFTLLLWVVAPISLAAIRFRDYDLTTPTANVLPRLNQYLPIHLRRTWTRLSRAPFTAFTSLVTRVMNDRTNRGWIPVARREFTVKNQSLGPPVLFGLTLVAVLWQLSAVLPVAHQVLNPNVTLAAFQFPIAMLGMLGAFFLGFRSIVHERESGAIRYTAGTPISRTNVILGKIVALAFAVGTPMMYALSIGGLVGILQYGLFSLMSLLGIVVAAILYLSLNAALITGLSTLVSTSTRAAALGFVYLLVSLLWQLVQRSVYSLFVGPSYSLYRPPPDTAYFFTRRLLPRQLFNVLSNWALGVANSSTSYANALLIEQAAANPDHTLISPGLVVNVTFDTQSVPLLLEPWVALTLLGVWILGLFALAAYRFQTTDLT